jgi:hypothetical protein
MLLTTARFAAAAVVTAAVFLTDRPFTLAFGTGSHAASVQLDL